MASPDGSYPMPVTLGDTTGLVVSIEAVILEDWPGDGPMVTGDPADPNALILSWLGGACEDETVVGFWPIEDALGCTWRRVVRQGWGVAARPSGSFAR